MPPKRWRSRCVLVVVVVMMMLPSSSTRISDPHTVHRFYFIRLYRKKRRNTSHIGRYECTNVTDCLSRPAWLRGRADGALDGQRQGQARGAHVSIFTLISHGCSVFHKTFCALEPMSAMQHKKPLGEYQTFSFPAFAVSHLSIQ